MSDIVLVIAVHLGVGVIWLSVVKTVCKRQFEYVSVKESMVHVVAWPWVFLELKLWWLALFAVATIGATAFAGVGALDSTTSRANSLSDTASATNK